MSIRGVLLSLAVTVPALAGGGVLQFGDADVVGTGSYGNDPLTGASTNGLGANATTVGSFSFAHGYPFSPEGDDYAGTDQIYVGSNQTGFNDGYSGFGGRIAGPQVITMDYNSLLTSGESIVSFTLGIMADDFQFTAFGNAFTAKINGVKNQTLSDLLNGLNQTGPYSQFVSIGLDVSSLNPDGTLTLSIDQGGNGGDGWAIDFLTIGVQTRIPTPGSLALLGGSLLLMTRRQR
jgi:hypothetical protein